MNKKAFWISYFVGVLLAAGGIFWGITNASALMAPDDKLTEMQLVTMQGDLVNSSTYKGKPLVVNIGATWCKPCLEEFPHFEEAKQQYGDKVNFVMISDETPQKVSGFMKRNAYTFQYLMSQKPLTDLGINIRPVTYFYNAEGTLIRKQAGALEASELKSWIEKAL